MAIVTPVNQNKPVNTAKGIFNMANTIQKEVVFSYKKKKDEATGAEIAARPAETLKINYPQVQDIISAAVTGLESTDETVKKTSENSLSLLQDALEAIINGQARTLLENSTADNFPYSELDWEKIANLPPAQRKGTGIPKEQWDAFLTDYCKVMPSITGKSQEQVDNAATLLGRRLATVKNSKDHLKFFETMINLYITQAENAGDFVDVLDFLNSKIEEYLALGTEDILAKL